MADPRAWIAGLTLLALTACAAGDVMVNQRYLGRYSLADRNYAASRGLNTEIIGNPFTAAEDDLRSVVVEEIRDGHFGQPFRMLSEDQADRSIYKVVFLFGQQPSGYRAICAAEPGDGAPAGGGGGGEIRVRAAFCAGDALLTSTRGRVLGARSPDDPRFRRLISQIGFELFPPFDDKIGDNDGNFL